MNFNKERPIRNLPIWLLPCLLIALVLQIFWHHQLPDPVAEANKLPNPPSEQALKAFSFGDPVALSKLMMIWLQAHDNPPGISIPFKDLDYTVLSEWLQRILSLDPKGHYPLLSAIRVFGEVPVPEKQRQMMALVEEEFYKDPNNRWPWMTHAVYLARHRLKDQELALKYAGALAEKATADHIPYWAKQMHIFLLEDMGEVESAKVLLGGLLESGQISDPNEEVFLMRRLQELQEK